MPYCLGNFNRLLHIGDGINYWDAVLAATMKEHGIFSIYTEDQHFSKIPWLVAMNPMVPWLVAMNPMAGRKLL